MTWGELTLGEVVEIKHGWAFKGEYFSDAGELILLTPGNVFETGGLKLKGDKEKYYTGEFPEEFLLESGDMIVVMTDLIQNAPILGASLIIPEDNRYLHNQRLGLVNITDASRIDYKFLYYVFNSPIYRGQIRGSATGATVRHTAPKRIYACKVPYPIQISEQKKIAGILSAYDDLIDNNNRRIALLEEAIHRLYREWFVHLRFPGHEHTPVVAGVPEGWEKRPLGDIAQEMTRRVHPSDLQEAVPYVGLEHIPRQSIALVDWASSDDITSSKFRFEKGEILFGKIRPYFHKVVFAPISGICSSDTIIMRPFDPNHQGLVLAVASSESFVQFASKTAKEGSKMPRANWKVMAHYPVFIPSNKVLADFENFVSNATRQIDILVQSNRKLREARDALLPRLMNGSLPV